MEPRGFEPLSRQSPSIDFHGCPPKLLNKRFAAETENDGNEWKLLDVTSIPGDLLPARFCIFLQWLASPKSRAVNIGSLVSAICKANNAGCQPNRPTVRKR